MRAAKDPAWSKRIGNVRLRDGNSCDIRREALLEY